MKRFFLLFAAIGLMVFSCTDDLQQELDDLNARVDALEAVASLEFQGNDLVVTYTDGTTSTVTTPIEVVPDHVSNFEIDTETNLITITFSDGTSKVYRVFSNGNVTYMAATLSGDYGITSMTMGDVTLANMSYDNQNRMVEALINLPDGNGNVINILELHNNYADANPIAIAISKSMESGIDYYQEEYISSSTVNFPGDSGYSFYQEDGEMYTFYNNCRLMYGAYYYNYYPYCWFVADEDVNYDTYNKYYPVPGEDSLFYKSNRYNYFGITMDDVYGRLYYPSEIIRITDVYQAGETMDTTLTRLIMRDDGLIEKVEVLSREGDEVREYFELIYDNDALLTKINVVYVDDEPSKKSVAFRRESGHYMSFLMTYTEGLVTSLNVEWYDENGDVDETEEIGEIVYDDAGNPVEIWSNLMEYGDDNDENFTIDENGKISIATENDDELIKIVDIEYNYTLPNFFGKTLEYLIPELKGFTINNAPTRITQSGFFNFAEMEYSDFNEGGYPAKVKLETSMMSNVGIRKSVSMDSGPYLPTSVELDLEYTIFE